MNANAPRFIVELNNNDHDKAAEIMLMASLHICEEMGLRQITFLVEIKEDFPRKIVARAMDRLIQSGTAKALCSRTNVIYNGINLHLESLKTFDEYDSYELLVGIYLSDTGELDKPVSLDKLDSPASVAALMYLPWNEKEGKKWLATWEEATVLGQENWKAEPLQLDESVATALDDLTQSINLSTGLTHSMDKKSAIDMFAGFRKKKLYPEPESIRQWALRHGWEPTFARELAYQAQIRLKHK